MTLRSIAVDAQDLRESPHAVVDVAARPRALAPATGVLVGVSLGTLLWALGAAVYFLVF